MKAVILFPLGLIVGFATLLLLTVALTALFTFHFFVGSLSLLLASASWKMEGKIMRQIYPPKSH